MYDLIGCMPMKLTLAPSYTQMNQGPTPVIPFSQGKGKRHKPTYPPLIFPQIKRESGIKNSYRNLLSFSPEREKVNLLHQPTHTHTHRVTSQLPELPYNLLPTKRGRENIISSHTISTPLPSAGLSKEHQQLLPMSVQKEFLSYRQSW